jgi:uncharacterized protein YjaZ
MLIISMNLMSAVTIKFSIDKNTFENLSNFEQEKLISRAGELKKFIDKDILSHVPNEILDKLDNLEVTIKLGDQNSRDGLFIPGEELHKHQLAINLIQLNSNGIKSLIAHEFFHAIHFEINPDEDAWIREGMAQNFEFIVTNELNGVNLQATINNPYTPLIADYEIENKNPAQYGHDLLYFHYIYNHCGKDTLFWRIASGMNNESGSKLIESALIKSGIEREECRSFYASAIHFEVSRWHNQIQYTKNGLSESFSLVPININPREIIINSSQELAEKIYALPVFSSMKINLEKWMSLQGKCTECKIYFAKKSFPYDVKETLPETPWKSFDIIIVKTEESRALTRVSSKNIR